MNAKHHVHHGKQKQHFSFDARPLGERTQKSLMPGTNWYLLTCIFMLRLLLSFSLAAAVVSSSSSFLSSSATEFGATIEKWAPRMWARPTKRFGCHTCALCEREWYSFNRKHEYVFFVGIIIISACDPAALFDTRRTTVTVSMSRGTLLNANVITSIGWLWCLYNTLWN